METILEAGIAIRGAIAAWNDLQRPETQLTVRIIGTAAYSLRLPAADDETGAAVHDLIKTLIVSNIFEASVILAAAKINMPPVPASLVKWLGDLGPVLDKQPTLCTYPDCDCAIAVNGESDPLPQTLCPKYLDGSS